MTESEAFTDICTANCKVNRGLLRTTALILFTLTPFSVWAHGGTNGDSAQTTQTKPCRTGPLEKNLMSLSTPPCTRLAGQPRELSGKQLRRLAHSAESYKEHLRVADQYRKRADYLEASALAYDNAATKLERFPLPKNLSAPGTAGRYRWLAKQLLDQASLQREKAESEDRVAKKKLVDSALE